MPEGNAPITGSMFQRRLLLLLGAAGAAMSVLAVQVARLTLAQGDELRAEAEAALTSRSWTPTTRGQILDRRDRVLAKDRPSYDVAADYDVISGGVRWARAQAGRAARSFYGRRWAEMTPDQRRETIDLYMAPMVEHLEASWALIARTAGVPLEQLEARKAEVLREVDRRYQHVAGRRLTRELDAQLALGREITADAEERIQRRAAREIEEQRTSHAVLPRVGDAVAFEIQRLAEQRVRLAVPTPDGGTAQWPPAGRPGLPLLPGVSVVATGDREYPYDRMSVSVDLSTLPTPVRAPGARTVELDGVAFHVLGRMRERSTREDNDRREARLARDAAFAARVVAPPELTGLGTPVDRGEYRDEDDAGVGGVEQSREDELRGLRGLAIEQRETGERRELPPEPGRDVRLTLDVMLQARVQAAMDPALGLAVSQRWHSPAGAANPTLPVGTPLHGAAVVLEIDSGEILAMVSTPSVPRHLLRDDAAAFFRDPINVGLDLPWVDRAVARPYPPGSIAKAIILNGAVKLGRHALSTPISCTGHLFPDRPDMFRCWLFKQHNMTHDAYFGHAPSGPESLMVSCNIYFFTLGQRLGPEGVLDTYRLFGLGTPWDLGLDAPGDADAELFPGYLGLRPDGTAAPAGSPGRVSPSDAVQMAIGQGPVAWTPLHAAVAYAALAQGGVLIPPRVVAGEGSPEPTELGLDPLAIAESLHGLNLAVTDERGTGHHLTLDDATKEPHFNAPGVQIWGKTGTATAPTLFAPRDAAPGGPLWNASVDSSAIASSSGEGTPAPGSGRRVLRWGDHSWFVVLVGRAGENRPRFAISVLMEYAGSGGKVSGPIVNQIIHALRAEGYL